MKNKGLFFTPILLSVLFSFTACQKTQTPVDTVQTLADISAFKTADSKLFQDKILSSTSGHLV